MGVWGAVKEKYKKKGFLDFLLNGALPTSELIKSTDFLVKAGITFSNSQPFFQNPYGTNDDTIQMLENFREQLKASTEYTPPTTASPNPYEETEETTGNVTPPPPNYLFFEPHTSPPLPQVQQTAEEEDVDFDYTYNNNHGY